jgi:O-Antigen ligase
MTTLIFGLGIAALLTCIVSIFLWTKVQFDWLSRICSLLILSLPFEYFPRLEIAGASWRISQFLVIIGFWIIAILAFKRDNKLLSHKLHFASWYTLVFLLLSSPSWFVVQDLIRFIVHLVGTIFVFGAFILLINFATDIWKNLQRLAIVLFGCAIFGLYQFFGDLAGIPPVFTLLREHYTKLVFGVPRVQGTAVEPLYFAGMLLIAIFVLIFWTCGKLEMKKFPSMEGWQAQPDGMDIGDKATDIDSNNLQLRKTPPSATLLPLRGAMGNLFLDIFSSLNNIKLKHLFLMLLIIFVVFLLTISKGTFGVLAILILVLLPVLYFAFPVLQDFVHKYIFQTILLGVLGLIIFFSLINPLAALGEIGTNFIETISGTSASAVERSMFVSEAINGIRSHPIFGIGMGQYGDYVGDNLGGLNEDGKAIVNNVYLEIWLEEGILALFFFLFVLAQPIFILMKKMATRRPSLRQGFKLAGLSLIFILIGYYIQWTLFSPIFIMPIFIMLGLAYNLIMSKD